MKNNEIIEKQKHQLNLSDKLIEPSAVNIQEDYLNNTIVSLFEWNNKINIGYINSLSARNAVPIEAIEMIQEMIQYHSTWLNRICSLNIPLNNNLKSWDDFLTLNTDNFYCSMQFLKSESYGSNFDWTFTYIEKNNQIISIPLYKAYMEIIMHSAFLRGKICIVLEQANITPPECPYFSISIV